MSSSIRGFSYDYEDSNRGRLLVVGAEEIEENRLVEAGVQMLKSHEIPSVLPLEVEYTNFKAKLSYFVKGKRPLIEIIKGKKLNFREYIKILSAIVNTIIESPRYFLKEANYVLDINFIFATNDYNLALLYLPLTNLPNKDTVENLVKNNIVSKLFTYVGDQDAILAKKVLDDFLSGDYSLIEISERLNKAEHNTISQDKNAVSVRPLEPLALNSDGNKDEGKPVQMPKSELNQKKLTSTASKGKDPLIPKTTEKKDNPKSTTSQKRTMQIAAIALTIFAWLAFIEFGKRIHQEGFMYIAIGITILSIDTLFVLQKLIKDKEELPSARRQVAAGRDDVKDGQRSDVPSNPAPAKNGPTTILNPTVALSEAYLAVENGGLSEKIDLGVLPVVIGRGKTYESYQISDTAISGNHARIEKVNGQYAIIDLNSTNHTYIDNLKLDAHKHYPLNNGAVIRMGKTNFIFHTGF